jgi:internalin A
MQIKDLATKFNLLSKDLKEQPTLELVMAFPNSYACNDEDDVIALNLSGRDFKNEQIQVLLGIPELEALNLSESKLTEMAIPKSLSKLQFLDFSDSELTELNFEGGLPNLKKLDISGCKLEKLELPAGFEALDTIEAQNNQLLEFKLDGNSPNLRIVDLSGNKIFLLSLPSDLPVLELLYLHNGNNVINISFLEGAPAIQTLNLHGNNVEDISPLQHLLNSVQFKWEKSGDGVLLEGCPLSLPPQEIVAQGNKSIINFFKEREAQGTDTLYEAKLLIVGEGESGKTSLCRRLFFPDEPLPKKEESTKGIDIHHFKFPTKNGKDFRINVWDFGGQQIYHATHQFFLTKGSLYVLLDDTRKNHTSVHDEDFKYWLEVVDLLSNHSPLLIFQNEKSGRTKQIDLRGIQAVFGNVKDLYGGDLLKAPKKSVKKIKEAIFFHIQQLPHVGESLPKKWIEIRSRVEELAKNQPFISKEKYLEIYKEHLKEEYDYERAMLLSRYLHDLGVFLHFQDDDLLERTVILENTWATEAVFKILDDEVVKKKFGRFTNEDCKRIWGDSVYVDKHPELRTLMEKFELCYLLPDSKPRTWLAPQMLPPSKPIELEDWGKAGDLIIRYKYDFLPKGLVNRLMVRQHRFVRRPKLSWQNGVLFEKDGSECLVQITHKRGNEIVLRSRGIIQKELLSSIANDLDVLNESYAGLPSKVTKLIPCKCSICAKSASPEFFPQKRLLKYKNDNRPTIECPESYEGVPVLSLLDGIQMQFERFVDEAMGDISEQEIQGMQEQILLLIEKKDVLAKELILASDSEIKWSLKKKVENLEKEIEAKRKELLALADRAKFKKRTSKQGTVDSSSDTLSSLLEQTKTLSQDIHSLKSKFEESFESIINKLDGQDVMLLALLDLSQSSKKSLAQLFQLMDANHFSTNEMEKMEQRLTAAVEEMLDQLPEAVTKKWSELKSKSTVNPDIKGKLKMKIPIIPTILSYEKEISYDLIKLPQRIWSDLKQGKVFVERLP